MNLFLLKMLDRACSACLFLIPTKASDMHLRSIERLNECDYEGVNYSEGRMHGDYRKQEFFEMPIVSFVSTGVCQRGPGHMWKRTDGLGDR